ncbi:PREDICTED: phosphoglucomutase-2-like [Amphimedon queenslandica]|uniref:Alpha-D-phosphohexomutase alpha/beta/alpha domain-containing protein n=2 Tax=Amphimedon queenslandica TaxID=400682 RepID=A0AAN0JMR1_AMPQE|nr:PREDICTED: phosphoglucomutase-2-like [Amphimedon queenslandica]|eukprot:XP_019858103.1 PREDICTED: phosphoglucomutase-2-like [Amphimedon queenslandica]
MEALPEELREKAQEWLTLDKNQDTTSEIESLIEARKVTELTARLASRMTFGTAGLRSKMGAGFSRMNDLTVIQTTQGLCKYLELQFGKEACQERGVVIGYDARYNSHRFSRYVANVFINEGIKVYLFSRETPTPFTPFALRRYSCVAGVMVTASHNPKQDNGYKVYWTNGAQIIPPHDKGISQCIDDNLTPWPTSWEISNIARNPLITDPYPDVKDGYFSAIQKYCYRKQENPASPVTCVYTAMHGVGYPFVKMAFEAFGLPEIIPVEEQVKPDPEFPTVAYPNPEEGKSALDLSISTAEAHGHSVIIANDPDADRLALAEKQPGNTNKGGRGNWRVFTGNEIGSMLGWWAMENFKKNNKNFDGSKVHLICSTVSSKLLRSIAKVEGIQFSVSG